MKNCHKRWKRERKAEQEALKKSSDKASRELEALQFFLHKHPDQANYELEQLRLNVNTGQN